MVRGAKRPGVDEAVGEAQGRVDLGGLEGLGARHLGEHGQDPAREHGLAGAGRSGEQDVVTARDGDFDGGAREVLAADLGHVDGGGAR